MAAEIFRLLGETLLFSKKFRRQCYDMKTDIYLGIDISTGLKAVAFAAGSGATLAAAGGALPYRQLPQGGCELAADAIDAALARALQGVADQLGARVRDIRALSCTGHGAGLYLLDPRGQLLGARRGLDRPARRARPARWANARAMRCMTRSVAGHGRASPR
ncbi:hypothetical protein WJ972_09390 [Achromobacter insuavis]